MTQLESHSSVLQTITPAIPRPDKDHSAIRLWEQLLYGISILTMGATMSACSNSTSWKEEVLLHDGKKMVVERSMSQDPKGNREIGQSAPKSEETLKFTLPGSSQAITWKSDFGPELQDNLMLLALEIVDGKPYLVTYPNCSSYNKWGRPNPAYVHFKFDRQTWQRIAINELPKEIRRANVLISGYDGNEGQLRSLGIDVKRTIPYFPAETIDMVNSHRSGDPTDLRMREFVREPIAGGGMGCADYGLPIYSSPKAPLPVQPSSQSNDPEY